MSKQFTKGCEFIMHYQQHLSHFACPLSRQRRLERKQQVNNGQIIDHVISIWIVLQICSWMILYSWIGNSRFEISWGLTRCNWNGDWWIILKIFIYFSRFTNIQLSSFAKRQSQTNLMAKLTSWDHSSFHQLLALKKHKTVNELLTAGDVFVLLQAFSCVFLYNWIEGKFLQNFYYWVDELSSAEPSWFASW